MTISPAERAARQVFDGLPLEAREVVREWLVVGGHDLRGALLASNALGGEGLITPRDARQAELQILDRRENSEHEASHAVCAEALGLKVKFASINADGSGQCTFTTKGGTRLERAAILMAPELWITRFRRSEYAYGAHGLSDDRAQLAAISSDEFFLGQADDLCMEILRQNRAIVLATAGQIERYGQIVAPWL